MDKQQTAVKNFLMKAYYVDEHINSKLEQVASLNELAVKATSTMSDMPGSPNRNIHKTEENRGHHCEDSGSAEGDPGGCQ